MTWGHAESGGDSGQVQEQLKDWTSSLMLFIDVLFVTSCYVEIYVEIYNDVHVQSCFSYKYVQFLICCLMK